MSPWFFVLLGALLPLIFLVVIPLLIIRALLVRKDSGRSIRPGGKVRNFLGGFPSGYYTIGGKNLDFKVDPSLYNFRGPKVAPNLDKLKKPLDLNTELAQRLYIGRKISDTSKELPRNTLDMDKAKQLFVPKISDMTTFIQDQEGDEEETS